MWECEWWRLYKTTKNVKLHIRENFSYRRPITGHQFLERLKKGNSFGYVQCANEVPKKVRANSLFFLLLLKNTLVGKNDYADLMKTYAEEEGIMTQSRKMLISSFKLQNGTLITALLLSYLQLGLVVTKIDRFVLYNPQKSFNSFSQSAVDTSKQVDKKPNSGVVAATLKLLANSSYGCQQMDGSQHSVTKYLSDGTTHAANTSERFRKLDHVHSSLYEVELSKAQIEHKEPIIVEFFIVQYSKLRKMDLYYNFFTEFCDVNKFEGLKKDTKSLYVALAEKELEDCIRPEMRAERQKLWPNDCVVSFTADVVAKFFRQKCCLKHQQHDKREPGLNKEEFRCTEKFCLCSKSCCCYDVTSKNLKYSSKCLDKSVLEQSEDGPLER